MKRLAITGLVLLGSIAFTLTVRSQAPAPAQTPLQALQVLKANNQKILNQQDATLQKLDELQKETHQLRIFARRS